MALDARPVRLPPLSGYVLAFVAIVLVQVFNPATDGIVRGLARMHHTRVGIEHIQSRAAGAPHDEFLIRLAQ